MTQREGESAVNHVNHEKLGVQRRSVVLLADEADAVSGRLREASSAWSGVPAPVDGGKLTLTCLAAAAAALIVFSIHRLGCGCSWFWRLSRRLRAWSSGRPGQLRVGALVCARQVVATFGWSPGTLAELDISAWVGTLSFLREVQTSTLLCQVFAGAMGLWLGWLFVRVRSFWLTFWGSFPLLMVPLSVSITRRVDAPAAAGALLGMGVLTRLPKQADLRAAKTTLVRPAPGGGPAGGSDGAPAREAWRSDQISACASSSRTGYPWRGVDGQCDPKPGPGGRVHRGGPHQEPDP